MDCSIIILNRNQKSCIAAKEHSASRKLAQPCKRDQKPFGSPIKSVCLTQQGVLFWLRIFIGQGTIHGEITWAISLLLVALFIGSTQ